MDTSLLTKIGSNLSVYKNCIISQTNDRLVDVFAVKGIIRRRPAWHVILVNPGSLENFYKEDLTRSLDDSDNGVVLFSGFGDELPENVFNNFEIHYKNFPINLEVKEKWVYSHYMLFDDRIEPVDYHEPIARQIENCSKLFYSCWGKEVPEALCDLLVICGIKREHKTFPEVDAIDAFFFARHGDLAKLSSLILDGTISVDVSDYNGWTLLHHAAFSGNLEVVKFLIENKACVNAMDKICCRKPAHIAAREGHVDVVEYFLRFVPIDVVDKIGWTLLHYTAWNGNLELGKLLMERNADIHAKDGNNQKKPLHVASRENHSELVEIFLNAGMDVNDRDVLGRTPMYYATFAGQFKTFMYLIKRGGNINVKSFNDVGLLHLACENNCIQILQYLLSNKCPLDDKTTTGWTALHVAACVNAVECLECLIEGGADTSILTSTNCTILDIALDRHSMDVVKYLLAKQDGDEENPA